MIKKICFHLILLLIVSCSSKKTEKEVSKKIITPQKQVFYKAGPTNSDPSKFIEKSDEYGLANVKSVKNYIIDLNKDGYSDLIILPEFFSAPEFYLFNKKKKKFEKLTYSPFKNYYKSNFLLFVDLNRDGLEDIIFATLNQKSEMSAGSLKIFKRLKGKKIQFEELKTLDKIKMATSSISPIDFNLNGSLDLFVGNWFFRANNKTLPQHDLLLEGKEFNFVNKTKSLLGESEYDDNLGLLINAKPTMGSSTCDVDLNGIPDILTSSSNGHKNKLWLGQVNRVKNTYSYQDYGTETGYASDLVGNHNVKGGGNTFFSACVDYNNDQIMDIFVGEVFHYHDAPSKDRSSVLTGSRYDFPPKFLRTEYSDVDESKYNQSDKRGIWADFNNDGLVDLLVENTGYPPYSRLVLFIQNPDHSFENQSEKWGLDILNPSGTTYLDVNKDGKLDILVGQNNLRNNTIATKLYLFENTIERNGNRTIKMSLRGKRANYFGLGATIILETNQSTQTRYVEYNQGPQSSQNAEFIIFGIKAGEKVKRAKIIWPFFNKNQGQNLTFNYDLSKIKFKEFLHLELRDNGSFRSIR